MNVLLIVHNIVAIVSAITAVGVAFFLFLNGKRETANITFALTFLAAAVFYISHVIGVNITDPELSRGILMMNVVVFFIGAFNYHAVLAAVNKDKEHVILLASIYGFIAALCIFFFIFPSLFLLSSVPKMYFPNYYEPGALNWLRILIIYCILLPASIYTLYSEYRKITGLKKKQLKFFIITMLAGYGFGLIPNFLIYNIPIDPLWGIAFAVICAVPLIYGALKYELFSVQVIAKQAFLYSLAVAGVGGLITSINYANVLITAVYPHFPTWTLALVSAVLAVSASIVVWRGLRKGDLLKAEFITTVTHKFRTPLTYIKWASENLANPDLSPAEKKEQLEYIRTANEKLVELTNVLTTASDAESTSTYDYRLKTADLSRSLDEVLGTFKDQFAIKKLNIVRDIETNLIAKFDESRLKFIIQVLLENALHYSSSQGTVTVSAHGTAREITCSVKDTGLGMTEDQISLLFSKFYRSVEARKLDTEGMGMGLFISAHIIEKHNGRMWAVSEGIGKGSTFYFTLPRVR